MTDWRRGSGWSPYGKMTLRLCVFGPPSANDHTVHARVIATQLSATCQGLHSQDRQTNGTRSSAPPVRGARVAHVRQVRARVSRRSFVDTQTGNRRPCFLRAVERLAAVSSHMKLDDSLACSNHLSGAKGVHVRQDCAQTHFRRIHRVAARSIH